MKENHIPRNNYFTVAHTQKQKHNINPPNPIPKSKERLSLTNRRLSQVNRCFFASHLKFSAFPTLHAQKSKNIFLFLLGFVIVHSNQ